MFSTVLGLFSQDLAVDLGTSHTRIFMRGSGVVCTEPTVVAVHQDRRGRRRVIAVGDDARSMVGRTPCDVTAVQPVRGGLVRDFEVSEALLLHLMRKVHGRNGWMSPRMVITVPYTTTSMERRALRESCEAAGARQVHLVPRPLAAALGADLPIDRPGGHMIVDVGGGATEVSVLSASGVVVSRIVEGGGHDLDDAVALAVQQSANLRIGRPTAQQLKHQLGCSDHLADTAPIEVRGRCANRGLPRATQVNPMPLRAAIDRQVAHSAAAINALLERVPAELASDISSHGIVLTGAGSHLLGLEAALRRHTGLPVIRCEEPETAVVRGAGLVLEDDSWMKAVAC